MFLECWCVCAVCDLRFCPTHLEYLIFRGLFLLNFLCRIFNRRFLTFLFIFRVNVCVCRSDFLLFTTPETAEPPICRSLYAELGKFNVNTCRLLLFRFPSLP